MSVNNENSPNTPKQERLIQLQLPKKETPEQTNNQNQLKSTHLQKLIMILKHGT